MLPAKTYMAPCKHRPATAAPFCRSYVSENKETSASTFRESIVSLRLPLLLPKYMLSTWPGNFQTCARSEFQPVQQDTHSRNMQHELDRRFSRRSNMFMPIPCKNGNMAYDLEPEAMCFKATAMTSSKYSCAGHMLRMHVNAM